MTHCCLSPPSPPAALSFLCLTNPVPGAGSLPAETLVWLNRRWSVFLPGPSWTPWLASHRPPPLRSCWVFRRPPAKKPDSSLGPELQAVLQS